MVDSIKYICIYIERDPLFSILIFRKCNLISHFIYAVYINNFPKRKKKQVWNKHNVTLKVINSIISQFVLVILSNMRIHHIYIFFFLQHTSKFIFKVTIWMKDLETFSKQIKDFYLFFVKIENFDLGNMRRCADKDVAECLLFKKVI